ncbi:hypothetical protein P22_0818 [Propionispora sp. 2/2-37]|nr:hypothetical protein P22_0818 [Propionispora sp. 2/2-37]
MGENLCESGEGVVKQSYTLTESGNVFALYK